MRKIRPYREDIYPVPPDIEIGHGIIHYDGTFEGDQRRKHILLKVSGTHHISGHQPQDESVRSSTKK